MRLPSDREAIHPGEILLEEFLKPTGISQYRFAKDTDMSYPRVNEIVRGKRGVTVDTAFRIARYFGTSAAVWLNLQTAWDLWHFERSGQFGAIQRSIDPAVGC